MSARGTAARAACALALLASVAACGGAGAGAGGGAGAAGGANAGAAGGAADGDEPGQGGAERPRSGLVVRVQNVRASGALPGEADPPADRLDVTFELVMTHYGAQALSGLSLPRVRLLHDDGREIVFGVLGEGWDGRLEPGTPRVVAFQKTPDSASPPPTRRFCDLPMRVEVTLELAGRRTTAASRRVQIQCPRPAGS